MGGKIFIVVLIPSNEKEALLEPLRSRPPRLRIAMGVEGWWGWWRCWDDKQVASLERKPGQGIFAQPFTASAVGLTFELETKEPRGRGGGRGRQTAGSCRARQGTYSGQEGTLFYEFHLMPTSSSGICTIKSYAVVAINFNAVGTTQ